VSATAIADRPTHLEPGAGYCEVSNAIRLVGDRWSLLVVRELAVGNTRFNEIHNALPGLSKSLLTTRLRYLERLAIVERHASEVPDRRSRTRYVLSPAGWGLAPVLQALGVWALEWYVPDESKDVLHVLHQLERRLDRAMLPKQRVSIQFHFAEPSAPSGYVRVDGADVRTCLGESEPVYDLLVEATLPVLTDLCEGRSGWRDAIDVRAVRLAGPSALVRAFPTWFPPSGRGASVPAPD
jgi:DNA-binding HxlR family transcriptional regulator